MAECLPFAGAVNARCFVEFFGDGGDAGHVEDHVEADVSPADDSEDAEHGGDGAAEPVSAEAGAEE